jgi:carboxypeptidase PM20D1
MPSKLRKTFLLTSALGLALIVVLAVCAINTARLQTPDYPKVTAAAIDIDPDAAAQRLAAAVRFKTISYDEDAAASDAELTAFNAWLEQQYPEVYRQIPHEVISGHSLLFRWQGKDAGLPPMLLAAHLDVVPVEAGTESAWTHPPFSGDIAEGFVWGRGSLDDKNSVLGILEAAEALLHQGFAPRRTIYLAFGQDEEISGRRGAGQIAALLQQRRVRLAFVLDEGLAVLDGFIPGLRKPAALIGTAEKGYATFDLGADGPGGHSSVPSLHNPLGAVARAVARISQGAMPIRLTPPLRGLLTGIAPAAALPLRAAFANLWLTRPLVLAQLKAAPSTRALLQTVVTPTVFNAGTKENVIPQHAAAAVNVRILPGDTVQSVQGWMRRTIGDPAVSLKLRPGAVDPSPVSAASGEAFDKIAGATLAVYPDVAVASGLMIGLTDSRHYLPLAAQTYRFLPSRLRPEDIDRIHGVNERIGVRNYAEIIRFYATLMSSE